MVVVCFRYNMGKRSNPSTQKTLSFAPAKRKSQPTTPTDQQTADVETVPGSPVPGPSNEDEGAAQEFEYYNGSADWEGFKRSKIGVHRHYRAQCQWCDSIIPGRPENLRAHKKTCTEMSREVRNRVTQKPKLSDKTVRDHSIIKMFEETERSQEDADYLLAMAIITSDVPYK